MITFLIDYVVGNTYKTKRVNAENAKQALKKARLSRSVVDVQAEAIFSPDSDSILYGHNGQKVKVVKEVPREELIEPESVPEQAQIWEVLFPNGLRVYAFADELKAV